MLWIISIISAILVYFFTNLQKKSFDLGFFIHRPGSVCSFGVLMGKIMTVLLLIQSIFIFKQSHINSVKKITLYLLILGIILSFMNSWLQRRLIIVFIIQGFLLYSLSK